MNESLLKINHIGKITANAPKTWGDNTIRRSVTNPDISRVFSENTIRRAHSLSQGEITLPLSIPKTQEKEEGDEAKQQEQLQGQDYHHDHQDKELLRKQEQIRRQFQELQQQQLQNNTYTQELSRENVELSQGENIACLSMKRAYFQLNTSLPSFRTLTESLVPSSSVESDSGNRMVSTQPEVVAASFSKRRKSSAFHEENLDIHNNEELLSTYDSLPNDNQQNQELTERQVDASDQEAINDPYASPCPTRSLPTVELSRRRLASSKEKNVRCMYPGCSVELRASKLENHVTRLHIKTKRYKCHKCDETFRWKGSLKMHHLQCTVSAIGEFY